MRLEHLALLEVDDGVERQRTGHPGDWVEVDVLDVAVAGQELLHLRAVQVTGLVGVGVEPLLEPGVAPRVELDRQVLEAHPLLLLVVLDGGLEPVGLWRQTRPLVRASLCASSALRSGSHCA